MLRLGVNIDHVATLRQARGGSEPDPVWAAALVVPPFMFISSNFDAVWVKFTPDPLSTLPYPDREAGLAQRCETGREPRSIRLLTPNFVM